MLLGAGEVAQHLDTAIRPVGDSGLQPLLEAAGLPGEGKGRAQVRVEQDRAAEVADESGDFGCEHLPVEERQVEEEAPAVAPGGDHLGEGGGQGGGGGDGVPTGGAEEGGLVGGAEPVVQAAGVGQRAVVRGDRGQRVDGRRQSRSPRQIRQPFAPPGGVPLSLGPSPGVVLREVAPVVEPEFARRFVRALVEAAQVGQEDPQAQRVSGHHVQVDLEAGPAVGEQAQGCAEDVTGADVRAGVGVALAQALQLGLGLDGGEFPQVVDGERRSGGPEALTAVLVEDGPEHAVPQHERPQGGVQPGRVDAVAVEFDVEVRGDAAEGLSVLASDPVGVLHRGQREGVRVRIRTGHRRGWPGRNGGGRVVVRGPREQSRPVPQGRPAREVLEGDRAALAPPGTDQGHQRQ